MSLTMITPTHYAIRVIRDGGEYATIWQPGHTIAEALSEVRREFASDPTVVRIVYAGVSVTR